MQFRWFFRKAENIEPAQPLSWLAWKRLIRSKLNRVALWLLLLAVVISILGYLIIPDSTPLANQQFIEIGAQPPLFRANMLKITRNETIAQKTVFHRMLFGYRSQYQLIPFNHYRFEGFEIIITEFDLYPGALPREHKFSLADVCFALNQESGHEKIAGDSVRFADVSGVVITHSINDLRNRIENNHMITKLFPLGTDRHGRDLMSQLVIGTRVSLSVGLISVIISLVIGILAGATAGYVGGRTDTFIVWLINVVWSVPTLLLVIAITFALGKGFWQVFVAVGLTMWVEVARVVRGQVISLRNKEYVEAARALGLPNRRIIVRHILPNVMGPVIVISAANFASAILIEAGLSFLGIGVQPPMPSWGNMIRDNYAFLILGKPWLPLIPGFAIMLMVLILMIIGNGLRDALDIRTIERLPGE